MLCGLCFFKRHILRVAQGEGGVFFFYTSATYSLSGWLAGYPIRVEMSGLHGVGIRTKRG